MKGLDRGWTQRTTALFAAALAVTLIATTGPGPSASAATSAPAQAFAFCGGVINRSGATIPGATTALRAFLADVQASPDAGRVESLRRACFLADEALVSVSTFGRFVWDAARERAAAVVKNVEKYFQEKLTSAYLASGPGKDKIVAPLRAGILEHFPNVGLVLHNSDQFTALAGDAAAAPIDSIVDLMITALFGHVPTVPLLAGRFDAVLVKSIAVARTSTFAPMAQQSQSYALKAFLDTMAARTQALAKAGYRIDFMTTMFGGNPSNSKVIDAADLGIDVLLAYWPGATELRQRINTGGTWLMSVADAGAIVGAIGILMTDYPVALSSLSAAIGFRAASQTVAGAAPVSGPTPTSPGNLLLGDLALDRYCGSKGGAGVKLTRDRTGPGAANANWVCVALNGSTAVIDMNDACAFQYHQAVHAVVNDPDDAFSWVCFTGGPATASSGVRPSATTVRATPTAASAQVVVHATDEPPGHSTGVVVASGQALLIEASGTASYGYDSSPCGNADQNTGPDGARSVGAVTCAPKFDDSAVLPNVAVGSLLGCVARPGVSCQGRWFVVGKRFQTVAAASGGELTLLYNDVSGQYANNSGQYQASVTVG